MLEKIVKYVPPTLRANKICRGLFWALFHSINFLNPKKYLYYKYQSHRCKKFKDIHKGQRCFIIGTGPSLNQTNLSLIKDEITFGVSTLYAGLDKFGITCDYYAGGDAITWQNHSRNIMALDTTVFISDGAGNIRLRKINIFQMFGKNEPIACKTLYPSMFSSGCFSKDVSKGVYAGGTVIITLCLQLAYYMGFKEVYLLGCDCDFSGSLHFDATATLTDDEIARLRSIDPANPHFTNDWSIAFESYRVCKRVYEEDGRQIINATVGGKLEVFERKKLEDIILSRK